MTPEEVYVEYLALKRHFAGNYNYHRYNGKVKASFTAIGFTRDRHIYLKISKHRDPKRLLLANILHNPKVYCRNLVHQEAEDIYRFYVGRTESLTYRFKQDLKKLDPNLQFNFYGNTLDTKPNLIVLYQSKEINLETLCILHQECHLGQSPQWAMEDISFLITKYTPFITYDRAKFRKLIRAEFYGT